MNQRDFDILWISRMRLIDTGKFIGCQDRDSLRLRNLLYVETETSQDWAKDVDTETPSRLSLISGMNIFTWGGGEQTFLLKALVAMMDVSVANFLASEAKILVREASKPEGL